MRPYCCLFWTLFVGLCNGGIVVNFGEPVQKSNQLPQKITRLDNSDFHQHLKANPVTLVFFYSQWDPISRLTLPHFVDTANLLTKKEPPVSCAVVNVVDEEALSESEAILNIPTIKLYLDESPHIFKGDMSHFHNIANWVNSLTGGHLLISTEEHLSDVMSSHRNEPIILCFMQLDSTAQSAFIKISRRVDGAFFAEIGTPELTEVLERNYEMPPIEDKNKPYCAMFTHYKILNNLSPDRVFVAQDPAMFKETVRKSDAGLIAWARKHIRPPVSQFNSNNLRNLFSQNLPIFIMIHPDGNSIFDPDFDVSSLPNSFVSFNESANEWLGKVIFVTSGVNTPEENRLIQTLGAEVDSYPSFRILQLSRKKKHLSIPADKYKPRDSDNLDGNEDVKKVEIDNFLKAFIDKKIIKPYLNSEPVAEPPEFEAPGTVKVLVGDTFKDMVTLNSKVETFVVLFAPWCGHCRRMEPALNALGRYAAAIPTLQIAKIDATRNEIPNVHINGYPTIMFYGQNKSSPISYNGDRTADAMFEWLSTHSSRKFNWKKEKEKGLKLVEEHKKAPMSKRQALEEL
eukprot:GHVP01028663.1.p1 GENE.GHVP01028663.1~~GHVP01028663.1.p1  ORF type:complete len:570 (+),score=82.17 GHVP01028663.1:865-2574(+)